LVGPICFRTESVKASLKTFVYAWKSKYSSVLHKISRERLASCIAYRENVEKRLNMSVQTLEQLNDALRLLEELSDMENKIDNIYLPIENAYDDLKRYELVLTRIEIEQVSTLRENWLKLMQSAENVRVMLLQEKRSTLEQELDKQVKTFVVEVIRFRNSFDATGPSVTGIDPYEAIRRLNEFQKQYATFDSRRKTLDSISMLFGLQCKPFPELDKTGEELNLLSQLYKLYQTYLHFDKSFRSTLWCECDLNKAFESVNQYWSDFLTLPRKLEENWEAYFDLKKALKKYMDVLPVLIILNVKEIRNRHWLQVMQATKSSFRLESNVFKLNDLVEIGLELCAKQIEEICKAAKKEQELESKMKSIEEEWNEQVLNFINHKEYGEICLDKEYTERLLGQLEDAQEILASMLMSKHIGPLRSEVSTWSDKLKTVNEVLELWLEVQSLWLNIESIFSIQIIVKEMPAEAKRFSRIDKSWIKAQRQSFEMKNVIQCCLGSALQENTKRALLKDIQKELEICFKALNSYLDRKRRSFPRFYLLSNSCLLTLLSQSTGVNNMSTVKAFLSSLFASLVDFKVDEIKNKREEKLISSSASFSDRNRVMPSTDTPNFLRSTIKEAQPQPNLEWEITEVYSQDGDVLSLSKKVNIDKGAELWITKLKDSVADSLKRLINNSIIELSNNSISIEELAGKYPAQICLLCLNYIWTKEAEASILELKSERKSIILNSKKFTQICIKLQTVLAKNKWPNLDKRILSYHKLRLEAMITVIAFLNFIFF
jgi:dynein heavy chain, axonemal